VVSLLHKNMGEFRTWFESLQTRPVQSVDEAKALSQSSGLDTAGIEFNLIEDALARRLPVAYEDSFPLVSLGDVPAGDKSKLLKMMGAFAQKMGVDAPDTLQQAQSLKIRGPDFKKMTPPIIVQKHGRVEIADGVSRVNAAKMLRIWNLRAFVIG